MKCFTKTNLDIFNDTQHIIVMMPKYLTKAAQSSRVIIIEVLNIITARYLRIYCDDD